METEKPTSRRKQPVRAHEGPGMVMEDPRTDPGFQYSGRELEAFGQARNWKTYLRQELQPFIGGDVLEVGAGIGGTTRYLCTGRVRSWTCLEPDARFVERLTEERDRGTFAVKPTIINGTLADVSEDEYFDTILYIDVLEHIEDDRQETAAAMKRLRAGGHLVVLCPALQSMFSEMDQAVGHFRRYTKRRMTEITPPDSDLQLARYLDLVGVTAVAANRYFLRRGTPSAGQFQTWDRWMVPVSRWLDPIFGHCVGRSVYGIFRKKGAPIKAPIRTTREAVK